MRWTICICTLLLTLLLSACIGGIDTGGGGGGGGGDIGAPTLTVASGDGQIVLAWTPDPTNPGDSYQLNRDSAGIYTGTDTAYNDLGLTNGQRYCYTVAAITGEDVATSAQVCATPMAGAVLAVTNQSLSAVLNWADVPGAVSYNLYFLDPIVSPSLSKATSKATVGPINVETTTYNMTDLSNNCVTYPVEIRPVDIDGNEGTATTQNVEPDTEGTLDTTFGDGDGYVEILTEGYFRDIAMLEDGTILGLRDMTITDDELTAYDEDGNVLWEVAFAGGDHVLNAVTSLVVDSDERIYIAGTVGVDIPKVCRLIPNGAGYAFDDANFGDGVLSGCAELNPARHAVNDITLDSQERIVVVGNELTVGLRLVVWVLVNDGVNDGNLDTNFNLTGSYAYNPWVGANGLAVKTVHDGSSERIYAVGEHGGSGAVVLEIVDDNPPNAPTVTPSNDAAADGGAQDLYILDDGDPLIVGFRTLLPRTIYSWLYSDFASPFTYAPTIAVVELNSRGVDVDCHERAVITGHLNDGASNQMTIIRTDDTLSAADGDFGAAGWYIDSAVVASLGRAIARDSLGRLLVAGNSNTGVFDNPRLWRLK